MLSLVSLHPLAGSRFWVGTAKPTLLSQAMFASTKIAARTPLKHCLEPHLTVSPESERAWDWRTHPRVRSESLPAIVA
ncbi:MAG TPA: hypothetical protein VL461_11485 [Dictyobacter sp.]|nr:hypothetical protein [Dictyobacter sp.]